MPIWRLEWKVRSSQRQVNGRWLESGSIKIPWITWTLSYLSWADLDTSVCVFLLFEPLDLFLRLINWSVSLGFLLVFIWSKVKSATDQDITARSHRKRWMVGCFAIETCRRCALLIAELGKDVFNLATLISMTKVICSWHLPSCLKPWKWTAVMKQLHSFTFCACFCFSEFTPNWLADFSIGMNKKPKLWNRRSKESHALQQLLLELN